MAVRARAYGLPKDAYDPLSEHVVAVDPHPGYLTPTEANGVYAVTGHNHTDYAASTHGHGVYQLTSEKGQPSGYAGLGTDTKVPIAQLPTGTGATQVAIGTHTHAAGAGFSAGVSNLGNTAGSTGVTGTRVVLVGTNNITLSQSTDANGGTVSISGPTTAAQTQESQSAGISNLGNTAGTSGIASGANVRLLFAGGNNITLSQSLNGASATITVSGPNTVAQTNQSLGVYALGNTTAQSSSSTQDARSHSVQGDGIISVGMSAGILRLSATVAAQSVQSLGIYALGNTTGQSSSSTHDARTLSVQGDGILSAGWSAGVLRLSVPSPAAQTAESQTHGMSNLGNTAGTSGVASGANVRLLLAGGANITLSQSLNGASGTITIVGGAGGAGFSAGVSNLGNTAGATGVTGTRLVLVGANNITLSQANDANGGTVSMSVAAPGGGGAVTLDGYNPYADFEKQGGQIGQGTLNIDPQRFDANVQFDRILIPLINTNSSNSSGSHSLSFWVGLYSRNVSTLSLVFSGSSSTNITHSGTAGSYSLYSGNRLFSIPLTSTVTGPADYWIGFVSRTTSGGTSGSYSNLIMSNIASNFLGLFGSAHNTTMQLTLGQGVYTVTTAGMPASIAFSHIRGSDSAARRAPWVMFGSGTA